MKATGLIPLFCLSCIAVYSCSDDKPDHNPRHITRLDRAMSDYRNMDSLSRADVLDSLNTEISALLEVVELDSTCDRTAMMWSSSLPVRIFSPMTDSVFADISGIEDTLGIIIRNAEKEGLAVPERKYAAVAWGKDQSIIFNGDVALIALNHYLGPDSKAYEGWPAYKRENKRRAMLPYDIAEALVATVYPYIPDQNNDNVLSRMLYEGALTQAKMRLVPDASLANALGFSDTQLRDIVKNEEFIWTRLVSGKMLYSTDEDLKSKLFAPLPYSQPISANAPGRTARFTGYEIVKAYLERNPETKLSHLLSPEFYNNPKALAESGYNPAVR